jgi:hypothetical protein
MKPAASVGPADLKVAAEVPPELLEDRLRIAARQAPAGRCLLHGASHTSRLGPSFVRHGQPPSTLPVPSPASDVYLDR